MRWSWGFTRAVLAVGSSSGEVTVADAEQRKQLRNIRAHTQRVGVLAWHSQTLATGSGDSAVRLFDFRREVPHVCTLAAHTAEVCGLSWAPDGRTLATGSADARVCLWDVRSLQRPWRVLRAHTSAVKALAWSATENGVLASGGGAGDGRILLWDTQRNRVLAETHTGSQVCTLVFAPHEEELLSTHGYPCMPSCVWDTKDACENVHASVLGSIRSGTFTAGKESDSSGIHTHSYSAHAHSQSSSLFSSEHSSSSSSSSSLLSSSSYSPLSLPLITQLGSHKGRVLHSALSPQGDVLLTGGSDECVCVWHLFRTAAELTREKERNTAYIAYTAYSAHTAYSTHTHAHTADFVSAEKERPSLSLSSLSSLPPLSSSLLNKELNEMHKGQEKHSVFGLATHGRDDFFTAVR